MGVFEGYTQMNYGDPDHMDRFELVKSIFPEKYTMKDIVPLIQNFNLFVVTILEKPLPVVFPAHNIHLGLHLGQHWYYECRIKATNKRSLSKHHFNSRIAFKKHWWLYKKPWRGPQCIQCALSIDLQFQLQPCQQIDTWAGQRNRRREPMEFH